MNNYAATMSSFADTNSALPIIAFSQNGSNRNTPVFKQRKSKKFNFGSHDDVDVLSRDNIESLLYVHVTNSIRISPSRSLTQSIVNLEKLAVSDIYSYLDKRISALKIVSSQVMNVRFLSRRQKMHDIFKGKYCSI